jgi:precorrin-2/cobalt-factor-2 C20-methyltransferase
MLIGVGLGPGDPELLTLKAVNVLKNSEKIYVPGRLAKDLVAPYANAEILEFPMIRDTDVLNALWKENADKIAEEARKGNVVFGLIGDPNFFSTFSHLKNVMRKHYPDVEIETIPGISSITSFAARTDVAIERSFEVSDGSEIGHKIHLKATNPKTIVKQLEAEGYSEFIFAERLFSENELIIRKKEEIPEKGNYFSILYGKK